LALRADFAVRSAAAVGRVHIGRGQGGGICEEWGKRLTWCLGSGKQECSGESFTEALMVVGQLFHSFF